MRAAPCGECYQVARTFATDTRNGNVAVQVAVEAVTVPANGSQASVWSPPTSEESRSITIVPTGTFDAEIATFTGVFALIWMSGDRKFREGLLGAATLLTETIRRDGMGVRAGSGGLKSGPTMAAGLELPAGSLPVLILIYPVPAFVP